MKKQKKFKVVPSPFGTLSYDEDATMRAFEEYVGGVRRAERLMYLWNNTYPGIRVSVFDPPKSKSEIFRKKAKGEGFTDNEADAFLML